MKISAFNSSIQNKTSFGQKIFEITNIDYLPCAYCGKDMISVKTLNDMFPEKLCVDTSMIDTARENGYLLKPFQQNVLNFLSQTQGFYNLENDGQILSKARNLSKYEVSEDIMERFFKIIEIIENSDNIRLIDFLRRNKDYCELALRRKNSYKELVKFVRNRKFLEINPNSKNKTEALINDTIYDIDTPAEFSIPSYIMQKSEPHSISEFYKLLFEKSSSSIEHIKPKTKGGKDKMSNYLAVCRDCNSSRGSISLSSYIKMHPEIADNIKKQLLFLKRILPKLISDNKIDEKYDEYPYWVSKTLNRLSGGKVDIIA